MKTQLLNDKLKKTIKGVTTFLKQKSSTTYKELHSLISTFFLQLRLFI